MATLATGACAASSTGSAVRIQPSVAEAAGQDSLMLEAVWLPGEPVPAGADIRYWVTWTRNGERIRSDTTAGSPHRVAIRRMGNDVPDTVLVTLWTLNHGVLSRRAVWKERIFQPSFTPGATIDLGRAEPPERDVPAAARPDPGPPAPAPPPVSPPANERVQPAAEPAPAPSQGQVSSAPPAPAPTPTPRLDEPPRAVQRVLLRVMNPPASWAAKGWSQDCPAGVPPDGVLRLVVLPETPEHCKPYITAYGGAGTRR